MCDGSWMAAGNSEIWRRSHPLANRSPGTHAYPFSLLTLCAQPWRPGWQSAQHSAGPHAQRSATYVALQQRRDFLTLCPLPSALPPSCRPLVALCAGLEAKLAERAAQRNLGNLTIGPVLSWTTEAMLAHAQKLLQIPGGRAHIVSV